MEFDVFRADPASGHWMERVSGAIGYVFTRVALLTIGVGLGYVCGYLSGSDDGFLAGCRATTTDTACLHADEIGRQIIKIRRSIQPGKTVELSVLCDDLRSGLSRRAAEHYGCDEQ
jgi:hypothetical protein